MFNSMNDMSLIEDDEYHLSSLQIQTLRGVLDGREDFENWIIQQASSMDLSERTVFRSAVIGEIETSYVGQERAEQLLDVLDGTLNNLGNGFIQG